MATSVIFGYPPLLKSRSFGCGIQKKVQSGRHLGVNQKTSLGRFFFFCTGCLFTIANYFFSTVLFFYSAHVTTRQVSFMIIKELN